MNLLTLSEWSAKTAEAYVARLAAATTRPDPKASPSANPGHLHQSTDRYSPTWVSRP